MRRFLKRLCFGLLLGAVLEESGFAQQAASLFEFLNAQADYRRIPVNCLDLIGSYLNAASRLNLAVGREVIP